MRAKHFMEQYRNSGPLHSGALWTVYPAFLPTLLLPCCPHLHLCHLLAPWFQSAQSAVGIRLPVHHSGIKTPLTSFQLWSVDSVDLLDVPSSRDMSHRPNCIVPIFCNRTFLEGKACINDAVSSPFIFSSGLSGSVGCITVERLSTCPHSLMITR